VNLTEIRCTRCQASAGTADIDALPAAWCCYVDDDGEVFMTLCSRGCLLVAAEDIATMWCDIVRLTEARPA
jgi:hypothetical protein